MAANASFPGAAIVPCSRSVLLFETLARGDADAAVLPFENTLHGSVAEHYDLLLDQPVRIVGESLLRIRHNVIVAPGVRFGDLRRVISHPVALSQCRRWLLSHPEIEAESFYDTAGSVKAVIEQGLRDTGGVAPALAAEVYGATLLVEGIEDHAENYTRFHALVRESAALKETQAVAHHGGFGRTLSEAGAVNKVSVAFSLEHRPGTLVRALSELASAGADLTRIESRPVHGRPWEYIFFADMRCDGEQGADAAMEALQPVSGMLRELGRYAAAELPQS